MIVDLDSDKNVERLARAAANAATAWFESFTGQRGQRWHGQRWHEGAEVPGAWIAVVRGVLAELNRILTEADGKPSGLHS